MIDTPQRTWNLGVGLVGLCPFIGLAIVLFDLPVWAEVVLVVAIIGLIAAGSTLMRRKDGAWLPSESDSAATQRPE